MRFSLRNLTANRDWSRFDICVDYWIATKKFTVYLLRGLWMIENRLGGGTQLSRLDQLPSLNSIHDNLIDNLEFTHQEFIKMLTLDTSSRLKRISLKEIAYNFKSRMTSVIETFSRNSWVVATMTSHLRCFSLSKFTVRGERVQNSTLVD